MRSLPEKDFWDTVRTRLRNYQDESAGDDDWDAIAAALKPRQSKFKRRALPVLLALLVVSSATAVWILQPSALDSVGTEHQQGQSGQATSERLMSIHSGDDSTIPTDHPGGTKQSAAAQVITADAAQSDAKKYDAVAGHTSEQSAVVKPKADAVSADQTLDGKASAGGHGTITRRTVDPEGNAVSVNSRSSRGAGESLTTGADDNVRSITSSGEQQSSIRQHPETTLQPTASDDDTTGEDDQRGSARGGEQAPAVLWRERDVKPSESPSPAKGIEAQAMQPMAGSSAEIPAGSGQTVDGKRSPVNTTQQSVIARGTAHGAVDGVAQSQAGSNTLYTTGSETNSGQPTVNGLPTPGDTVHTDVTARSGKETAAGDHALADASAVKQTATDSVPVKKDSARAATVAQRKEQAQKKKRKAWNPTLYVSLTPSLAFQKITPQRNDDVHIAGLSEQSMFSGKRAGISLETGGQISLQKGFDVYAGVLYYQQNQSIAYRYTVPSSTQISETESMDYVFTPDGGTHTFRYAMRNIGASAGFLYTLKDARLMHKLGAGLQYQHGLVKADADDTYTNRSSQYLYYQIHYRLEWAAAGRARLYLQPAFVQSFWTSESLREPLTVKPYRVGLTFGVTFSF